MTIRKIHVPLIGRHGAEELEAGSEAALRVGFTLGHALRAHVEVCCIAVVWYDPEELLAAAYPSTVIEEFLKEVKKRNDKGISLTRSLFDRVASGFRPQLDRKPTGKPMFSAEFLEITGEIPGVAAERGKFADLSVVASKPRGQVKQHDLLLQTLLTDTGRPLMVVPEDCAKIDLDRVAIAWNDTNESARAVAMSMDFIRQASEAVIIAILEDGPLPSGPQELADYLRWHGVRARVIEVSASGQGVGKDLLTEADKAKAGLLVMGAYTRGKLQRFFFGGATGGVLEGCALPLLMVD
jgi:nucleotide-binding universal stress UspA family protein